jgi:mannonate dehydratase
MHIRRVSTILTCPDRNYLIVRVETDSGVVGYGDATLNGRERAVQTLIDEHLAEWLVGRDAERIEDTWQMVFRHTYFRGGPVMLSALAGIDMALWDIKGKVHGAPVYDLLGGKCRERALAYLHVHGRSVDELIARSRDRMRDGCRAIRYSFDTPDPHDPDTIYRQPHQDIATKERIEVTPDTRRSAPVWDSDVYLRDLTRVTATLRQELGEHVGLIHDAHERLSVAQARQVARELDPYRLFFLEDPLEPLRTGGLREVRAASTTPIAMGELYNTLESFLPVLAECWIDYLRLDLTHFGGISPARRAAAVADAYGVRTAFHGPSDISPLAHAANVHLDLALPNFGIQEFVEHDHRVFEVFRWGVEMRGGYIYYDGAPGLGVEVDEETAARYPYRPGYLPSLRDAMGAVHDW